MARTYGGTVLNGNLYFPMTAGQRQAPSDWARDMADGWPGAQIHPTGAVLIPPTSVRGSAHSSNEATSRRRDAVAESSVVAGSSLLDEALDLGARYRHNPWKLAAALEIPIRGVNNQGMTRLRGRPVTATLLSMDDGSREIVLNVSYLPSSHPASVSHELCHALHSDVGEDVCEQWADAFLGLRGR